MNVQGGLMGGIFKLSEWFMKFTLVNILWLIFNLPIVFLMLNLLLSETIGGRLIFLMPIIILLPFIFFPATTAMFAMAREWVFKDRENNTIVKTYWKYYKENYKRSMFNGFLLTIIWGIWSADVYYFSEHNFYLFVFFLIMGIPLYVFTLNSFSVAVHYDMSYRKALRTTFFITMGSPVLFLAIAISTGFVLYLSVNVFSFLIPFLTGTLMAFFSFSAFYSRYLKVVEDN